MKNLSPTQNSTSQMLSHFQDHEEMIHPLLEIEEVYDKTLLSNNDNEKILKKTLVWFEKNWYMLHDLLDDYLDVIPEVDKKIIKKFKNDFVKSIEEEVKLGSNKVTIINTFYQIISYPREHYKEDNLNQKLLIEFLNQHKFISNFFAENLIKLDLPFTWAREYIDEIDIIDGAVSFIIEHNNFFKESFTPQFKLWVIGKQIESNCKNIHNELESFSTSFFKLFSDTTSTVNIPSLETKNLIIKNRATKPLHYFMVAVAKVCKTERNLSIFLNDNSLMLKKFLFFNQHIAVFLNDTLSDLKEIISIWEQEQENHSLKRKEISDSLKDPEENLSKKIKVSNEEILNISYQI